MSKRNKKTAPADAGEVIDNAPEPNENSVTGDGGTTTENAAPESADVTSESQASDTTTETTGDTTTDNEQPENERATPGSNSDKLKAARTKLMREVTTLATAEGEGGKALVALAERVCQAALDGVITTDHTKTIYEKFRDVSAKAAGGLAPESQAAASKAVQVSKLNAFVKLGILSDRIIESDGYITDAVDLVRQARGIYIKYFNSDDKHLLKAKGGYASMLAVAQAQLKAAEKGSGGMWLTEQQLFDVLVNPVSDKKEKTATDLVKEALDKLEKARDGKGATENKMGRAPLDHGNLTDAIGHLWQVLRDLDPKFVEAREAQAASDELADAA